LLSLGQSNMTDFQLILTQVNNLLKQIKLQDTLKVTFLYQLDQVLFQVLSGYVGRTDCIED
jgi:hypothetical protein